MGRETLSSRDRVIRTLNHQTVDRYPIDLGMHPSSGISAFAYQRLREHLGLPVREVLVPDLVQMLAKVDEDVIERFHLDCIMLEPAWPTRREWRPRENYRFAVPEAFRPEQTADGEWIARQGQRAMRMPAGGFFFDGDWLSNWGGLNDDEAIALYAREARRIYDDTPYATCFVGYSYGGGIGGFFNGIENAVLMLEDPATAKEQADAALRGAIRAVDRVLKGMGKHIQMLAIADDMGTQSGPMCRPSMMAEFVFPYYKRFCDFVHNNSDVKVFLHCCGSIRPLVPMMVEAGIDVLNPVQISAGDMDPATLKSESGGRIVFWGGGCNTQNVLGVAAPEQVRLNVRELASCFKPGGGFVFNQVHNVMGDVPPANIVAMLEEAYRCSFYEPIA